MLPIYNASYSSSVIPIILGVLLMSKVEPWATRISPKAIRFFTAPLLTMFICGIATLCVLGPVGYVVSNALAAVINGLSTLAPLAGAHHRRRVPAVPGHDRYPPRPDPHWHQQPYDHRL